MAETEKTVRGFGPCGDCKFYIADSDIKGSCHEGPPQVLAVPGRPGGVIAGSGGGQSISVLWPPLPPDAPGCGKFLVRK